MTHRPARLDRQRQQRQFYVRTDRDILVNTENFMTDLVPVGQNPIRWGDFPNAQRPAWWLGSDTFDGGPIGPNGPYISGAGILPALTRCLDIITNTCVRTQWRYFSQSTGEFFDRPLFIDDPMMIGRVPGPVGPMVPAGLRLDGHAFYSTWLSHAVLWGLGAFVTIEAADGTPLPGSLRIVNPYMLGLDERGHWVIDPRGDEPVSTDFDGRFSLGGQRWRLVTLRGLTPNDSRMPEGVLLRHWDTFKVGASVTEYVAGTFSSGIPAGYLKIQTPNAKQAEVDALRETWMRAHGNSRRSIAVLSSTVDFAPISMSPVDAEAVGIVHILRSDIAHAFGLSAIWLDEGSSGLTYNNNSDRRRDLVDISLSGWSERLMAVITSLLPYGQRAEVSWTNFVQPSISEHMAALVAGVQVGILTGLEARQYLGLARPTGPDPAFTDHSPAASEIAPAPAPTTPAAPAPQEFSALPSAEEPQP